MVSLAVISTNPAFPLPRVLELTSPPLVTEREPVSIMTLPAFPDTSAATPPETKLGRAAELSPSIEIVSLALISIDPAFP